MNTTTPAPGTRVRTLGYGEGTVLALEGRLIKVQPDNASFPDWFSRDEVFDLTTGDAFGPLTFPTDPRD